MRTYLLLTALIGISFSGGNLSGKDAHNISAHAYLVEPPIIEQVVFIEEEIEVIEVAPEIEIYVEPEVQEITETRASEEPETYDMIHQKDVAEEEDPVPPEVSATWYVEDAAVLGLEAILAAYPVFDYEYFIVSTPSNYIYQYDFYVDSPDGGHANLVGIYQYDATGQATFHLNPVTGSWT